MATFRQRGNKFEFIVRRKGLLPKPVYLYFDTQEEGKCLGNYRIDPNLSGLPFLNSAAAVPVEPAPI